MDLGELDLLFWAMSFVANLMLLFVLFFRSRFRNFPLFTALIALNVTRTVTLYLIRRHNTQSAYFYTFWTLALVDVGLQFGIVYEVSSKVFRPMGKWVPDLKKVPSKWVIVIVTLTSLLTLIPKAPSDSGIQEIIVKSSFLSAALMSELFVGMLALSAVAGLTWTRHVAGIAKGFTTYSIATLILETANTCLGLGGSGPVYDDLSRIRIGIYLCCVAYWGIVLWRDAPPPTDMPDHIRKQAATISQAAKLRLDRLRGAGES